MDIKNLKTFIHVAELNSFTKTAEVLGYSQSTISFQIKQLENELNCQLFERINHTIALTDKGKEVLSYAHEMIKLTKELKSSIQDTHSIYGHIRLAMADSLCHSLLEKRFDNFRQQYPEITLKINASGTEEMFRFINHNEVDIILTLDSHINYTEYIIAKEEKVKVHFVVQADSPLANMKNITIKDILQYPFILTEKGMSYRRILDEKLAELSLEIEPILEIGNTSLICSLVKQGIGVSFLPDYVTDNDVLEGKMVYLDVIDFDIEVWKQLLYHRNKWLSLEMKSVIQYCIDTEFKKDIEEY